MEQLCSLDAGLIPDIFQSVKRIFTRISQAEAPTAMASLRLQLLSFFVKHGEVVVYDTEAAFSSYFGETLSGLYHNPVVVSPASMCVAMAPGTATQFSPSQALETLLFCLDNIRALVRTFSPGVVLLSLS